MSIKESWIDKVTPALKTALQETALASYTNACDLLRDAKVLKHNERHARAGVLAILSEEEFSKAFILLICAYQNRWDSEVFDALRRHPKKQGVAKGMRDYFEWFVDNYTQVMAINRLSIASVTPAMLPSHEQWARLIARTKKVTKGEEKERHKQSLLYVGFNRKAIITSDPRSAEQTEIEQRLEEAQKFKEIVEIALAEQLPSFCRITI